MHTDLTKGSTKSHLIKLSIPSITGYFFHTMFNVTDTFFAGEVSTEALAALSLSASIFFMVLAIAIGMSEALTVLVANSFGEKEFKKAQNTALNGIVFAFVLSIFLTIISIVSIPYLIALLADASYINQTMSYVNIILYATLFFIASFFFNALLVAVGDTKSFRNILIFTSFLNIFLDYIFIHSFSFGVNGIAIATVIAEFITMLYLYYKLKKTKLWTGFKHFTLDIEVLKELLKQGFAPSMNMFMMAFGMYVITYFVAPYGKEAIAGYGIGMRIEQIFLIPVVGLGIGTLSIVSQNNGAKFYSRIEETTSLAIKYGFYLSTLGIIAFYTIGEEIASLLSESKIVQESALLYLHICGFAFYGFVMIFIYISMLQGIKKTGIIFPLSVYRQVVAPIILFSFFSLLNVEIYTLWLGLNAIIFSSAFYLWWYARGQLNTQLLQGEIK